MTCKEVIEKNWCLGCMRAEKEDQNSDQCEYKENGFELCKKIIEGVQLKIWV